MKTIALAYLSCLGLLTAQATSQPAKNEFSMEIESVKCQVKAYRPTTPIVFDPMVDKDFHPKSQLVLAIMLNNSDISSYMSDEEISGFFEAKLTADKIQKLRSALKEVYESAPSSSASSSVWKGMKYVIDQAFLVESEKGKFLVYQLKPEGGSGNNGKLTCSVKNVAGKWSIGRDKSEAGEKFQLSMMHLVPAEFEKLRKESSVEPLPLEALLN